MSEASKIKNRLKEIATQLADLNEGEGVLTDEQEQTCLALEAEADKLTEDLAVVQVQDQKIARQQKAASLLEAATASTRVTTPNRTGLHIGRQRLAIEDDPKRGFRSFAEYAAEVRDAGESPRNNAKLMQIAAGTGMTQSINTDGGVLVPPGFAKTIWDKAMMKSNSLLGYCDQVPVDAGVESVTVPAKAESSRANGSRQGGVQGYWKGELSLMTSSQMKMREVKFTPQELYVFCFISDKLLRNSPGTASKIMEDGAADEIAFKVGDAIFAGDGNGKPIGVVGHTATVSVAKETGQAAATVVPENISKMWARCLGSWRTGAVWFINQDVETALRNMKFEVGTGGIPVFLPPGGMSESPYSTLYGRPVVPIEYCSTVGTVGDIVLANMMSYAAAVKGMTDTAYSMHLKFDYAQTAYRVIFEMDGQPWLNKPITPYKGSNTLSPIVTLDTRA